jgi:hypothetical protein
MFKLRFAILNDEKDELSNITDLEKYEVEFGEIEGQLELNFEDKKYGFVDESIPFGNELLILWFRELNKVVLNLQSHTYVAFKIPETDSHWYEFLIEDKFVIINEVKSVTTKGLYHLVITEPLIKESLVWNNVKIKRDVFQNEIIEVTEKLLEEITLINGKLIELKAVKELIRLNKQAKQVICDLNH